MNPLTRTDRCIHGEISGNCQQCKPQPPPARYCEHGKFARTCIICEHERTIARLRAQLAAEQQALAATEEALGRAVEAVEATLLTEHLPHETWGDETSNPPYQWTCRCGARGQRKRDLLHKPDCVLAATVAALPPRRGQGGARVIADIRYNATQLLAMEGCREARMCGRNIIKHLDALNALREGGEGG